MIFELKDIQKMRKMLNLTQSELANLSGVSQSLIAKIERGLLDPSFSKTMAIFQTLQRLQLKNSKKAKDVMKEDVIYVDVNSPISQVVELMHKHAISQMPVLSEGEVIGSISEKALIERLYDDKTPNKMFISKVKKVIEPPFPIVDENAPLDLLPPMLNFYPAILVIKEKKIIGIITRADLLQPK